MPRQFRLQRLESTAPNVVPPGQSEPAEQLGWAGLGPSLEPASGQTFVPVLISFLIVLFGTVPKLRGEDAGYPRGELLVSAAEVSQRSASPGLVILDVRPAAAFAAGHVPHAVHVDVAEWGRGVLSDLDPESWSQRFRAAGINADSEIVVYDDNRQRDAARAWWILKLWGVQKARIVDGGWTDYAAAGLPIATESTDPTKGTITASFQGRSIATKDDVLNGLPRALGGRETAQPLQLIDTRSKGEYCGIAPSRTKQTGTIPGSKHLEWSDLLEPESSRFKPAPVLKDLFRSAGIDPTAPSAAFCQGGGRASVMAFGLELMGSPESRNYYASWGEWGNQDDLPIEHPEVSNQK